MFILYVLLHVLLLYQIFSFPLGVKALSTCSSDVDLTFEYILITAEVSGSTSSGFCFLHHLTHRHCAFLFFFQAKTKKHKHHNPFTPRVAVKVHDSLSTLTEIMLCCVLLNTREEKMIIYPIFDRHLIVFTVIFMSGCI